MSDMSIGEAGDVSIADSHPAAAEVPLRELTADRDHASLFRIQDCRIGPTKVARGVSDGVGGRT